MDHLVVLGIGCFVCLVFTRVPCRGPLALLLALLPPVGMLLAMAFC
jgi:hypothetical protein